MFYQEELMPKIVDKQQKYHIISNEDPYEIMKLVTYLRTQRTE